jgi:23S rRNA pseudouridine1911/1915/1917 synthase
MPHQPILVPSTAQGERLDIYLAKVWVERFSRSQIKKLIDSQSVRVNGKSVSAHYRVKGGDQIQLEALPAEEETTRAEDIPLEIIYEDEEILIVNKPAGMVVHPAHGNPRHTLVNALLYHTQKLSSFGGEVRPGIVHRLDKDTSGILVVAKTNQAHAFLSRQFKKHTIQRTYYAVVRGVVQHDEGICEEPVGRAFLSRKKVVVKPAGGKEARTHYRVVKRFKHATLLEVEPKTGRTHQIRVHLAHLGHPVLGDLFYGVPSPWIERQALHAARLSFLHPKTREQVSFESPLPSDMKHLLSCLESEQ